MRAILLLAVLAAGGAEVYRWVDADGVVHFTDRPVPGAERLLIEPPPPASDPGIGSRRPPVRAAAEEPPVAFYDLVAIQSPGQDEVLWNIEGQLDVSAAVNPPLRPGHRLRLFLDGSPVATLPPGQTSIQLTDVFRGEHSLRAEVLDQTGATVGAGPVTSFAVRQTSIENPVNPITAPVPTPLGRP